MTKSLQYSIARKAYWATIPKEKRSEFASHASRIRYGRMTEEEKKAIAVRLHKGKRDKKMQVRKEIRGDQKIKA